MKPPKKDSRPQQKHATIGSVFFVRANRCLVLPGLLNLIIVAVLLTCSVVISSIYWNDQTNAYAGALPILLVWYAFASVLIVAIVRQIIWIERQSNTMRISGMLRRTYTVPTENLLLAGRGIRQESVVGGSMHWILLMPLRWFTPQIIEHAMYKYDLYLVTKRGQGKNRQKWLLLRHHNPQYIDHKGQECAEAFGLSFVTHEVPGL